MNSDQLLELLKAEIREEDSIRSSIRTTMNIYITMLVAILGGLATLVSKNYQNPNHILLGLVLLFGGIIVVAVAYVALQHYISGFRRQVEAIVQEAKLESLLGMDKPEEHPLTNYWKGESLLPESFLQTRQQFEKSSEFVKWMVDNTDVKIARLLYWMFMAGGFIVSVVGIIYMFI